MDDTSRSIIRNVKGPGMRFRFLSNKHIPANAMVGYDTQKRRKHVEWLEILEISKFNPRAMHPSMIPHHAHVTPTKLNRLTYFRTSPC